MSAFLTTLFKLSLAASLLIAAVVVFRLAFRRAPKWIRGVLWTMVAVRLVFPIFPQSPVSVIPRALTANYQSAEATELSEATRTADAGPSAVSGENVDSAPYEQRSDPAGNGRFSEANGASESGTSDKTAREGVSSPDQYAVLFAVWASGAAAMAAYALISRVKLRRQVRASIPVCDVVFATDYYYSPFLLGVIRPKIYVPYWLSGRDLEFVLRHESAHAARRDDLRKLIGFLILAVYWFCPTVWVGYALFCRDIEYSCDEAAVRDADASYRADYSKTLVDFGLRRHALAGPLGFGKLGVKRRVENVIGYKKPKEWMIAASLFACAVIAVCFLTSPGSAAEAHDDAEDDDAPSVTVTQDSTPTPFVDGEVEKLALPGGVGKGYEDLWGARARAVRDAAEPADPDGSGAVYTVSAGRDCPLPAGRYVFETSYPTARFVPIAEYGKGYFPDGIPQSAYNILGFISHDHRECAAALASGDPTPFYVLVNTLRRDAEERFFSEEYHMTDEEFTAGLLELTGIASSDLSSLDARRDGTGQLYFSPRYGEGECEANRIVGFRETENGYEVTFRSYADFFLLVPSDLYVISIARSDGDYEWVIDDIRIVERGDIPPARIPDLSDRELSAGTAYDRVFIVFPTTGEDGVSEISACFLLSDPGHEPERYADADTAGVEYFPSGVVVIRDPASFK